MSERAPLSRELTLAAEALALLLAGRALPAALDAVLAAHGAAGAGSAGAAGIAALPPDSHAAVRDMAYRATRQLGLLQALAALLNRRPPAARLAALQAVALSQLIEPMRAEAVIVDQAVSAARAAPDTVGAAGFLNATLRGFLREREALLTQARRQPAARWNHPEWWIDLLRRDHPEHWQAILACGNGEPPMSLRVNRRRTSADAYLARLAQAGIEARRVGSQALVLERAVPVATLPGWHEGDVSVQDPGAQLAAVLLAPGDGERVLDACAAPGGKTTHLLELADCAVTALDVDEARLAPVRDNLQRLGQQARVVAGDARRPGTWWDGEAFDRILVDAPCTASGILRRHPDIRWLRRPGDLASLATRQLEILTALWPLLRPGGRLLYATCSVFADENETLLARFFAAHPDATRPVARVAIGEPQQQESIGQLLPCAGAGRDHDGFFYALLEKPPAMADKPAAMAETRS